MITKGKPGALLHGEGHGGELLVLIGCVCWIVYTLGARRFPDFSPLRYTALSATYGTLTIFAVTAIVALTGGTRCRRRRSATSGGRSLYIIFAGAVIAVLAWNEGVRRIGPANGALFMNLVPIVSFAIAIGQRLPTRAVELLGALLTIAALIFANLAGRRRSAAGAARVGPVKARARARRARPRRDGAPARGAPSA